MLPGMDGFTFAEWLRQQEGCERLPVVVLSAMTLGPEERERLHDALVGQIWSKGSATLSAVLRRVGELLDQLERP